MDWCPVHKKYCHNVPEHIKEHVRMFEATSKSAQEYDSADFIIEKFIQIQPSWYNSRITYRLFRWTENSSVKNFEGDFFWLGNLRSLLHNEFGLSKEQIESIPLVDLTEQ